MFRLTCIHVYLFIVFLTSPYLRSSSATNDYVTSQLYLNVEVADLRQSAEIIKNIKFNNINEGGTIKLGILKEDMALYFPEMAKMSSIDSKKMHQEYLGKTSL